MFTVYDTENECFTKVKEPDPSLRYTYADYLKWNFEERVELFRGKIFHLPTPYTKHQQVAGNLIYLFHSLLKNISCHFFSAPFDIRLPFNNRKRDNEITTVVQPDISIICDNSKIDDKGCCGAPDVAVEILSPGDSYKEVRLKFELYEEAGVKEYWIVSPAEENLVVFVLNEHGKYPGGKMYAGKEKIKSTAVPELIIITEEIFAW